MEIQTNSKVGQLLQTLQKGESLTESQISSKFGLKSPRDAVYRLRRAGYVVNTRKMKAKNNHEVTVYEAGTPSRELIAAGYLAMSMGLA